MKKSILVLKYGSLLTVSEGPVPLDPPPVNTSLPTVTKRYQLFIQLKCIRFVHGLRETLLPLSINLLVRAKQVNR